MYVCMHAYDIYDTGICQFGLSGFCQANMCVFPREM